MSNVAHVLPQRRAGQTSEEPEQQPSEAMTSKPEFQYVNLMQNGVLKKIIVPISANTSVPANGQIFSVPQISPTTSSQMYAPYVHHVGNTVELPAPSNLIQARQKLSGALAKNKVFLTTAQGIGSLNHQAVNRSNLTTSTFSGGQAVQTTSIGQVPVLLMPSKQPTLAQGVQGQQVLLTNTQQAQVVMTAQGTHALLLPAAFQGQHSQNSVLQIANTSGTLSNNLVLRTASGTGNIMQLGSGLQNLNPVSTQSSIQSAGSAMKITNPASTCSTSGAKPDEEDQSSSGIRIGSVFSLKDMEKQSPDDAVLSKVIMIEPEDSDVTVNVEDDDYSTSDNSSQQMFASDALQQQAGYQVLAEWDQETPDEDWISHPEPSQAENLHHEMPQKILKNLGGQLAPEGSATQVRKTVTTTVTTDHMVSTLETALKSPSSGSVAAKLPDGRIVLISPSGGSAEIAKDALNKALQTEQKAKDVLNTVLQTDHLKPQNNQSVELKISPPKRINVVKVSRVKKNSVEQPNTTRKILSPTKAKSSSESEKKVQTLRTPSTARQASKQVSTYDNGAKSPEKKLNHSSRRQSVETGVIHQASIQCHTPLSAPPSPARSTSSADDAETSDGANNSHNTKEKTDPRVDINKHADAEGEEDKAIHNKEMPVFNDTADTTSIYGAKLDKSSESHSKESPDDDDKPKNSTDMQTDKCSKKSANKSKRTRRPKRNLNASYVKLTPMKLGKKTTISVKRCRIPSVRQALLTEPKATSTNVFHISDHIPSALDLKAEAEAEVEAKERELTVAKAGESKRNSEDAKETEEIDRLKKEIKTLKDSSENEDDTKNSKAKKKSETKNNQNVAQTRAKKSNGTAVGKAQKDEKDVAKGKSNFFLVKTSVGNYLVPMSEGENGAVASATKVKESLEEYLAGASAPSARKSSDSNTGDKEKDQKTPSSGSKKKTTIGVKRGKSKSMLAEDSPSKSGSNLSPKRGSSAKPSDGSTPAKVPKLSLPAEKKPRATNNKIQALKEKLKRDQEKIEAIRRKKLIKTSLSEFDDL